MIRVIDKQVNKSNIHKFDVTYKCLSENRWRLTTCNRYSIQKRPRDATRSIIKV